METVGRYRIVRELGRGGMGVVYEAFDPAMARTVALKVIRCLTHSTDKEYDQLKQRFLREAAAAGRLSHPNIVHINNIGEDDGLPYLDMDYVAGEPLKAMLAPGVPMIAETTLAILTQIAAALDYAHAKGIVHRDIKPPNILVEPDGAVKLTDFGIAHITSETITPRGMTMGTLAYMAPEQIRGNKVDGRTDQFALAVIAYEMLAGQLPFVAPDDVALQFKIAGEEPRALHEVNALLPRTLSPVVSRALSKVPEKRYRNCVEFVGKMRSAASYTPTEKEHVASIQKKASVESTHRRKRWQPLTACAALVIAIAGWFVYRASKEPGKTLLATDLAKGQLPGASAPQTPGPKLPGPSAADKKAVTVKPIQRLRGTNWAGSGWTLFFSYPHEIKFWATLKIDHTSDGLSAVFRAWESGDGNHVCDGRVHLTIDRHTSLPDDQLANGDKIYGDLEPLEGDKLNCTLIPSVFGKAQFWGTFPTRAKTWAGLPWRPLEFEVTDTIGVRLSGSLGLERP